MERWWDSLSDHLARCRVQRCEKRCRSVAPVAMVAPFGLAEVSHYKKLLAIQRLDLGFLIDTKHQHPLWRVQVSPTMSRTFSANSHSVESLKVSLRYRCNPNATHIRWLVEGAYPVARAIERSHQSVAPGDVSSRVLRIISALVSSPILRGALGRCSL